LTKQLLFVLWPLLKATAQGPRKKEKPSSVLCGSIAIAQSNCTWAKKKKIPLDSKARSQFVSLKIQKHHESQST
jgi:hypothetical protein